MKKGQGATELLVVFALVLIILLAVLALSRTTEKNSVSVRNTLEAQQVLNGFVSSLNQAYISGDGSRKEVFLPPVLQSGQAYNLSVYPSRNIALIEWRSVDLRSISRGIITADVTGTLENFSGPINISNAQEVLTIQ